MNLLCSTQSFKGKEGTRFLSPSSGKKGAFFSFIVLVLFVLKPWKLIEEAICYSFFLIGAQCMLDSSGDRWCDLLEWSLPSMEGAARQVGLWLQQEAWSLDSRGPGLNPDSVRARLGPLGPGVNP